MEELIQKYVKMVTIVIIAIFALALIAKQTIKSEIKNMDKNDVSQEELLDLFKGEDGPNSSKDDEKIKEIEKYATYSDD